MTSTETPLRPPGFEEFERARDAMLGLFKMAPLGDPNRTIETVAERVRENQQRANDMMGTLARAWSDLASRSTNPEAFRSALEDMTHRLRAPFSGEEAAKLFEAWQRQTQAMFGAAFTGAPSWSMPPASLSAPEVPAAWTEWLSSPGFGSQREHQNEAQQLFGAWLEQQAKEQAYRSLLGEAFASAFRRMTERLASMARDSKMVEGPKALTELWVEVADAVFTEMFASPRFAEAQSAMLNATHRVRRGKRALVEQMLKAQDMPTRSEVDEAHRTIAELRRELRAMKKDLGAMRREGK